MERMFPLANGEDEARLRALLDQQLTALSSVVSRLANKLQRRLMAQQNRAWEFDLEEGILPFFETHQLVVKAADFRLFAEIVRSMRRKEHLTPAGFERAVRLAYAMNAQGKQRSRTLAMVLAGSSETARWAPIEVHDRSKGQSDPHGDMGSQAEMTWPQ